MPGRHSLFWKLVVLVAGFCLSMIWASHFIGRHIDRSTSYLSPEALETLSGYAEQAQDATHQGADALQQWLARMQQQEPGWKVVLDEHLQPLGGQTLTEREHRQLTFVRHYQWPMSRRQTHKQPLIAIPFEDASGQLVMRLPERFRPWRHHALLTALGIYLLPVLLSVLFCGLLYAMLISPLQRLRRHANALRGDHLDSLTPPVLAQRRDELGELGRSLAYLTQRLRGAISQQQQLLRDLSHELRTPLSRLRVASESHLPEDELRERLEREVTGMQQLVENTLELAWLDSQQPRFDLEPVDIAALWDVLCEDACFESGWPRTRIHATLPPDCRVLGHLNALAQAMENILRNAIRHSPPDGQIGLSATREGASWCLSIQDQGPGVAEQALETIFRPFARLSAARPGGDGFGLGLAIAFGMVRAQGGTLLAESTSPGLRVRIRLQSV